jgi:gluconolactonase
MTTVRFAGLGAPSSSKSSIVKLDPSLDALVSPDARLQILKEHYFGNSEGPVWIAGANGAPGYLLFSDIGANNIYQWTPDGKVSVFLKKTGWSGTDINEVRGYMRPEGGTNFGSNGIALDSQGRLVWCAQGDRAVVRQEKDGKRTFSPIGIKASG